MLYFLLAGILALVILGGIAVALLSEYDKGAGVGAAVAALIALVALTVAFSATTVSPRAVGIQTSFGRYVATLDNGFHWTSPWSGVEEFSTLAQPLSIKDQPVSFAGTTVKDASGKETVSGSGGGGDVDGTILWSIDPTGKGAEKLWEKYKTYDNVRDNLVEKAFKEAARVQVGAYSPVEAKDGKNLRPINEAIKSDLVKALSEKGIVIDTVSVTDIALDSSAQQSLNRIVEANANTERAKSEKERARIDAETAKIRNDSGSLSGPALVRLCLDVTNAWDVNKNGPLPAGWSCTGGNAGAVLLQQNQAAK